MLNDLVSLWLESELRNHCVYLASEAGNNCTEADHRIAAIRIYRSVRFDKTPKTGNDEFTAFLYPARHANVLFMFCSATCGPTEERLQVV